MDDHNDIMDITIDIPETDIDVIENIDQYASLSESYAAMMSVWNNDSFRQAAESLSNSMSRISEIVQPIIASREYYETALSSIAGTVSQFSQAVRPLAESCALESARTAVEAMQRSLAGSNLLAEAVQNSAVTALQGITPALKAAVTPAISDIASQSLCLISDNLHEKLMESSIISDAIKVCSSNAFPALTPALSEYIFPAETAAKALGSAMSAMAYDFSGISEALLRTYDYMDAFSEMIQSVRSAAELMANRLSEFIFDRATALHDLGHLLLRILWRIKERGRKTRQYYITGPPPAILSAAALAKVKTAEPIKYVDYSARIRKLYLQKHQRISDESDDLDNDSTLKLVA